MIPEISTRGEYRNSAKFREILTRNRAIEDRQRKARLVGREYL
ncbi:hypothetical protein QUB63_23165 [Microcoleus sp. ARI1-B5]